MTTNFDWDQFEESEPSSAEFDWGKFEETKKKPDIKEMKRTTGRHAKVIGSEILGIPGDIKDLISRGGAKAAELITGKTISEEQIKKAGALMGGFDLPTSEQIKGIVEKGLPELAPRDEKEKSDEAALGLISGLLIPSPLGKGKALAKTKGAKELEALYKHGKAMGLSAKQLTPLFQSEKKLRFFGRMAKRSPGVKKTLELTEDTLSKSYNKLSKDADKLPDLSRKVESKLVSSFRKIKNGLQDTIKASPDKESAIHFIEDSIEKIISEGATSKQLMNFYKDIGSSVNWTAIRGGKKALSQLKAPIYKALAESDPRLFKNFKATNDLYSRLKKTEKAIGLSKIAKYMDYGKWATALSSLTFGSTVGLKAAMGAEVAQRISTQILTNPHYAKLEKSIINSMKTGKKAAAWKTYQSFKRTLRKEDPSLYEEIDWDELDKG